MAKKTPIRTTQRQEVPRKQGAKCAAIAAAGITNGQQFLGFFSALISDLVAETVSPGIGNAACNAGGKMLKMVELNQKYGKAQVDGGMRNFQLIETA